MERLFKNVKGPVRRGGPRTWTCIQRYESLKLLESRVEQRSLGTVKVKTVTGKEVFVLRDSE